MCVGIKQADESSRGGSSLAPADKTLVCLCLCVALDDVVLFVPIQSVFPIASAPID